MGAAQYEVLYELDATGNAEAIALMEKVPTGAARNVAEGFSIRAEGTVSGGVFAVTAGSMTRASASDGAGSGGPSAASGGADANGGGDGNGAATSAPSALLAPLVLLAAATVAAVTVLQ
mmetsp:Transcript_41197/g.101338  ORF Transcript_41197/g.101338 Transcript_41197/m.101338 type:complete len:119 (+) Transcript_41197:47-403(+)